MSAFVNKRLRELGYPVTLFGESDEDKMKRLRRIEEAIADPQKDISEDKPRVVEEENQEKKESDVEEMDPMKKKFFLLKNRMKEIGGLNLMEVANEEGNKQKKKKKKKKRKRKKLQDFDQMNFTGERSEWEQYRQKKRQKVEATGWDMYSDEFKFRMHQKRCKNIGYTKQEYVEKLKSGNQLDFGEIGEDSKQRMAKDLLVLQKKREKFNRRRTYFEDENVSFISERNRNYNKKLAYNYDKYKKV